VTFIRNCGSHIVVGERFCLMEWENPIYLVGASGISTVMMFVASPGDSFVASDTQARIKYNSGNQNAHDNGLTLSIPWGVCEPTTLNNSSSAGSKERKMSEHTVHDNTKCFDTNSLMRGTTSHFR